MAKNSFTIISARLWDRELAFSILWAVTIAQTKARTQAILSLVIDGVIHHNLLTVWLIDTLELLLPATFSTKLEGTNPLWPFISSPKKYPSYFSRKISNWKIFYFARSTRGLALIKPDPGNLLPTRLQSSRGWRNARRAGVVIRACLQARLPRISSKVEEL